ncbi:MAG: TetR/AcrR family transcriptional regulator C-terminal domain-containing protein [Acutalibacteraceae bacterium]
MKNEEMSLRTKEMLACALKRKMAEKSLSKITVSELIRDCDINRNTFYYHFEDIYALLKWTLEQEAINVVKQIDLLINAEEAIRFVLDYAENNKHILACAYDSLGYEELKRFFYTDVNAIVSHLVEEVYAKQTSADSDRQAFFSMFYTEAIAGSLINYLKDTSRWSRNAVVENLMTILNGVLQQASTEKK